MIDTCDSRIACWSEDGETFIVKNTDVFEKSIIPQFFKHSKFSSFVRQLNFYGFRKIKYADTLKIDYKLEAETANFWRFRHDKFQRGRPELLIDIKRSNGQHNAATSSATGAAGAAKSAATVSVPKSSGAAAARAEDAALKNEVTVLKKRIEAMTKNIDDLTTMVQQVSLSQNTAAAPAKAGLTTETPTVAHTTLDTAMATAGSKRKKIEGARPDAALSGPSVAAAMELDQVDFRPEDIPTLASISPLPPTEVGLHRDSSITSSNQTDDDFVDQLFTAFESDDMGGLMEEIPMPSTEPVEQQNENSPDPELMKKLSDALTLLPKEIQEMIVDRLVATITGTESIEKNVKAVSALTDATRLKKVVPGGKVAPNRVPPSPTLEGRAVPEPLPENMPMPLAAATLAALLTHYSGSMKDKSVMQQQQKALLPVIPISA